MSSRVLILVLALLAVPYGATAQDAGPTLRITAPAEGATVSTSSIVVKVDVGAFKLVSPATTALARPGEGHLHVMLDGKPIRGAWEGGHRTTATSFLVSGLTPGTHGIRVELRDGTGAPLTPPVAAEVSVTVAPESPYIRFREGRPWPGQLTGGSINAEVDIARPGGLPLSSPEVRWSLDGKAVATTRETAYTFANLTAGIHRLRAELLVDGDSKAYDELLVGVPKLKFTTKPDATAVAGKDFAPAVLSYVLDLDGATLTDHKVRLMLDGKTLTDEAPLTGTVEVPLGEHVVAAELLGLDMRPLNPVVGTAALVRVDPPPPDIRFQSPKELATVAPKFIAAIDVSNLTLVAPGGPVAPTEGHVHWYLDGAKVADGPETSFKFDGLTPGLHTIEVRIADNAEKEYGPKAIRKVNVEAPPVESGGPAVTNASPAGALVAVVAAFALAALGRRR